MNWAMSVGVMITSIMVATGAFAQDIQRNTVIFGDDLDFIETDNARQCARACSDDGACNAWTFVKSTQQCRLKSSVFRSANKRCCHSGTIERASQTADTYGLAGRVTRCQHTFGRNASGWRKRRWRRSDCSNGLPPAGAVAIGQGQNGSGSGGQVQCTPNSGRHFNNPSIHGQTTGTVICLYISG